MAVSTLLNALLLGAAGVVLVVAVSAVFYAVGRSEDRERAGGAVSGSDETPARAPSRLRSRLPRGFPRPPRRPQD